MTMTNTQVDGAALGALRELAERLARTAAEQVRRERPETVTVDRTKLNASDVVTAADLAAERLLREMLAAERPDDAILGEEGGATAGTSGLTWVVDPIDGTVNYLYGLPSTSVSVAVVAGEPVNLIETLAERIADVALGDRRVQQVTVTVHKPQAPIALTFGDVPVTVHRTRAPESLEDITT